jgi:hypothetical protein
MCYTVRISCFWIANQAHRSIHSNDLFVQLSYIPLFCFLFYNVHVSPFWYVWLKYVLAKKKSFCKRTLSLREISNSTKQLDKKENYKKL